MMVLAQRLPPFLNDAAHQGCLISIKRRIAQEGSAIRRLLRGEAAPSKGSPTKMAALDHTYQTTRLSAVRPQCKRATALTMSSCRDTHPIANETPGAPYIQAASRCR